MEQPSPLTGSLLTPILALIVWSLIMLAWAYVGLRILHSLVQATVNIVLVRFAIFIAGTLALALLAGRDAWALFA